MIYLDNHSTTPVDNRVLNKMLPYFSIKYNNPHSQATVHNSSIIKEIDNARKHIANLIGAEKDEIVFTSGATESNNLAIKGMISKVKRGKNHFITLSTEHKCVLEALRKIEFEGAQVSVLKVKKNGLINIEDFKKSIKKETLMVSIMIANNETGVIQPIEKIAKICKQKGILFHTDAAQAIGKIKVNVKKMNIDLMSISSHKFYGPKGIGALYVRKKPRIRLNSLIDGGGQEMSIRSGTLPVPLCIGFGEAARIANKTLINEFKRTKLLRDYFLKKIEEAFPDVIINGSFKSRLPANLNISINGVDAETLISKLRNTVISAGSACSSNDLEPSPVLSGMGLKDNIIRSALRIGFGRYTSKKDTTMAAKEIIKVANELRKNVNSNI
ncbi:MAG: Cysteine desulfurase IscS [Alphaproteobacteria bacterium MarineAlpha9_Bin4]|nr:MAG: Cysteine desulfurase IscS [Alphaproteobacteria bacterium MarineAlpha9_Bin4]|tara:strand:- start:153 stop:1307 length:1155 start_codon:yes stop_codon:yes gene_type:complete